MKQFSFPFAVMCNNEAEYSAVMSMLKHVGYIYADRCANESYNHTHQFILTNFAGDSGMFGNDCGDYLYEYGRVYICDFNIDLIHDIAAACTNDTWQEGERFMCSDGRIFINLIDGMAGRKIGYLDTRRPTLEQICEYHGYQVIGKNIVHESRVLNGSDCSCWCIPKCDTNALTWSGKDHTLIAGRPNKGESMIECLMCKQMEDDAIEALKRVQEIEGCKYTVTKTETTETKLL